MFNSGKYSETAEAIVLDSKLLNPRAVNENNGGTYEFVIEVRSAQREPFRTIVKYHGPRTIRTPMANSVIRVKLNPKTQKVKLMLEGDPRYDLTILARAIMEEGHQHRATLLAGGSLPFPEQQRSHAIIEQMMRSDVVAEE
jgi:hypothetical protein